MKISFKSLFLGTLVGTTVMFFWGATEWFNPLLHLPYHHSDNSADLNKSLQKNMPKNGIYIWPNGPETKTSDGKVTDIMYFIAKQEPSYYQPVKFMLTELFNQVLTWLIISYLMLIIRSTGHFERIRLVILFATLVGLGYLIPMWNWWGFSSEYVLTRWLNLLVGWALAGTAISFTLKRHFQTQNH